MESEVKKATYRKIKRASRVRRYIRGTEDKPRMSVFKSNKHISVQIIDDESRKTVVSASTLSMGISGKSREVAKQVGAKIAELALQNNISKVVFDRGSAKYHGALAELADAARSAGLQF